MLKIKLFLTLLLLFLIAGCSSRSGTKIEGQAFPYTKFTMLNASTRILKEWEGQPVVIMFWSLKCPVCERAISRLNEEVRPLVKHSDIIFIAVNLDSVEELSLVEQRTKNPEWKWFYHAFSGNEGLDEAFVTFKGSGTPFFVLVDRAGYVKKTGYSVSIVRDFAEEQIKLN
ncbi:MAG: redoxin domain-containing protein [SAR324 cluster bacterium]|uniref:Redoxin domain-containing protein n=1 Tax=SAR324 cluster bacterium TaxID=2024889 RepID=A0A7X9FU38_9DELT|nr:redoxin domain-containing protein [SAR324 cluster bacterium]